MDSWPESYLDVGAARRLLAARSAGDAEGFYALLDERWLELWYAFEPTDLRRLIMEHPPPGPVGPSAALLVRLAGADVAVQVVPRLPRSSDDARTRLKVAAHDAGQLRLKGRPGEALELIQGASGDLPRVTGGFVDASDGLNVFFGLHAGSTALLAGDLATARAHFMRSAVPSRSGRFPFAPRDVAAKTALTHAVAGDMGEARQWLRSARSHGRTASWVEALIDDSLWLVEYLLAIESLDLERAEQMRLEKPSPLAHVEFWGVALQAQVHHLMLTGRRASAVQVCDAVGLAGLPHPGSDTWQATILAEARVMCRAVGEPVPQEVRGTPLATLAHRVDEFAGGRFDVVAAHVEVERLDLHRDVRPALALRLLRAQALKELGRLDESRGLLEETLEQVLARGLLSLLGFVTPAALELVEDEPAGRGAREALAGRVLPRMKAPASLRSPLTPAEVQAVGLLAQGLSRAEIADQLFLSINTVKSQLATAYRKLGVRTRAEAVAKVRQLGL